MFKNQESERKLQMIRTVFDSHYNQEINFDEQTHSAALAYLNDVRVDPNEA